MTTSATAQRPALAAETPCAVCGRLEYAVVGVTDRDGRPLRTVMCRQCGLVWTNPRPSDADVDRYYAREYRADYARHREPTPRKVLRGILDGDPLLSVRADMAEECWRIVEPVIRAWRNDEVPLEEYPAGSLGPKGW